MSTSITLCPPALARGLTPQNAPRCAQALARARRAYWLHISAQEARAGLLALACEIAATNPALPR
jgi:hypothetical protein